MYGYKSNFFNKDFIDSFRKSINESLTKGNGYGIGVNKQIVEDANENIGIQLGGPEDFSKVSDLQLQNRMRRFKRSNIFTGVEPDEKQNKEYISARNEFQRREAERERASKAKSNLVQAPVTKPATTAPSGKLPSPMVPPTTPVVKTPEAPVAKTVELSAEQQRQAINQAAAKLSPTAREDKLKSLTFKPSKPTPKVGELPNSWPSNWMQ